MKLAYMYATPEVTHSKVTAIQGEIAPTLARIREVGYQGVELLVCDPARIDARAVEKAIADEGLDVPAICTGEIYGEAKLSFADPSPAKRREARERMKDAMALASRFDGAVNVGRLRGRYQEGIATQQTLDWITEALVECSEAYPGTHILMEPVNHLYANCLLGTQEMLDFIAEVARPNVGIMLDMVHILVEGEDLPTSLRRAQRYGCLRHFHVSDSDRLPVGDGEYDIAAVMASLRDISYDRYVTAETFQIPNSSIAIQASFDSMRPYFSF